MTPQEQQRQALADLQKEYDDAERSLIQAQNSIRLLELIEEGIFTKNALACVQYANNLFILEKAIKEDQWFEKSALECTVKQLRSRKYRRYFLRATRDYDANTLEAISKADTSGIFVLSLSLTAYINKLYEDMFAATATESQLHYGKLLSSFKKERLKELVQIARQYNAETLCSILQNDTYGFFSRDLLADSRIAQTLESCGKRSYTIDGKTEYCEDGLVFARKQLYAHLEALEQNSQVKNLRYTNGNFKVPLTSGINPVANLVKACRLKCINPHQYKFGININTGIIGWLRDFFGYHSLKKPYNPIRTLFQTSQTEIPIYLGRQPTRAVINELKISSELHDKKILLISIQTPEEGYTDEGVLKKIFRGSIFNRTHLITAESVPENVDRLSLSLMDHSIDVGPQELLAFVQRVKAAVDTGEYGLVYSHCRGGKARSAGITALVKCCCNKMTLEAAFTDITSMRSSAKGFTSFNHKRADVLIRTYFLMVAQDVANPNNNNALISAEAATIATHLKWYLENATLTAQDEPGNTSCANFWQVVEKLAQDKAKFPKVLSTLLHDLNDEGLEKLMETIILPRVSTVPTDLLDAIKADILVQAQATLQEKLSIKPTKKILLKLKSLGGKIFDAAIALFKLQKDDEVMQVRKEVFLAHPETLVVKKVETQATAGVPTQQIELALGALVGGNPQAASAAAPPVRATAVNPAIDQTDRAGEDIEASICHLITASLGKHLSLSPADSAKVLKMLQQKSGIVLVKDKRGIYQASEKGGAVDLTIYAKGDHPIARLFTGPKGIMQTHHGVGAIRISHKTPLAVRPG